MVYSLFMMALAVVSADLVPENNCTISTSKPCGVFNRSSNAKIFGGSTSSDTHWPWLLFIKINRGYKDEICTGSLLSETWVLSAGHCFRHVHNYNRILIIHGLRTNIRVINPKHATFYTVLEIHSHPKFQSHGAIELNDLALIKVKRVTRVARRTGTHIHRDSVKAHTGNYMPVCIENLAAEDFTTASICYVAGYGYVDERSGKINYDAVF